MNGGTIGESDSNSIALQTTRGWDIPNSQIRELSQFELNHLNAFDYSQYGPSIMIRSESALIYNCHGMIFGSRRTAIYEPEVIIRILQDDNYSKLILRT